MEKCMHVFSFTIKNLSVDFICLKCGATTPIPQGQTLERIYEQPHIVEAVITAVASSGVVNAAAMEERIYKRIIRYMERYDRLHISRHLAEKMAYQSIKSASYKTQEFAVFSELEVVGADTVADYTNACELMQQLRNKARNALEMAIIDGLIAGFNQTELAEALSQHFTNLKAESIRKCIARLKARLQRELAF